jgi:hypothetical protein
MKSLFLKALAFTILTLSFMTPQDILKAQGGGINNDAGLQVIAYYALYHDIETFPAVPAAPADFAEKVTITSDFVMKSTKRFWQIQSTLEMTGLDTNMQGERDGRSSENIFTLQHPGTPKEMVAWIEEYKNADLVFIIKHIDGVMRVIGSEGLPASLETFTIPSGMAVADSRHVNATIRSIGRIAPFYEGAIPLTPAV